MTKHYFSKPTLVIFLNEKEDFIHGGIAYRYAVIDLTDGEEYPCSEIEIKSELSWKDLEHAAMKGEMDYYDSEERIFLINWVESDGFDDGSETFPLVDTDPENLTELAYKHYTDEYKSAEESNGLEEDSVMLSYDEFRKIMESGFRGESDYVLIQTDYDHTQFEGYSFPIFEKEV